MFPAVQLVGYGGVTVSQLIELSSSFGVEIPSFGDFGDLLLGVGENKLPTLGSAHGLFAASAAWVHGDAAPVALYENVDTIPVIVMVATAFTAGGVLSVGARDHIPADRVHVPTLISPRFSGGVPGITHKLTNFLAST